MPVLTAEIREQLIERLTEDTPVDRATADKLLTSVAGDPRILFQEPQTLSEFKTYLRGFGRVLGQLDLEEAVPEGQAFEVKQTLIAAVAHAEFEQYDLTDVQRESLHMSGLDGLTDVGSDEDQQTSPDASASPSASEGIGGLAGMGFNTLGELQDEQPTLDARQLRELIDTADLHPEQIRALISYLEEELAESEDE